MDTITINAAALADEIGKLDAIKKQIEERLNAAKDQFKALGVERIEGAMFRVEHGLSERSTLDLDAAKAKLGAKWCAANSKVTMVSTVRIKHLSPSAVIIVE